METDSFDARGIYKIAAWHGELCARADERPRVVAMPRRSAVIASGRCVSAQGARSVKSVCPRV